MIFKFILLLSIALIAVQIQRVEAAVCPSYVFTQKHLCSEAFCNSEENIIKKARGTFAIFRDQDDQRPTETLFVPTRGSMWREYRNANLNKVVCEYEQPVTCYKVTRDRKGKFHCKKGRGNGNHIKNDNDGGHLNHNLPGTCEATEACP